MSTTPKEMQEALQAEAITMINDMPARLQNTCLYALEKNSKSYLYFAQLNITDQEFSKHFVPFLQILSRFSPNPLKKRVVHFNGNAIGNQGAKELAELLKTNTFIDLCLSDNPISDTGAEYLAEALKQNNTLQRLILNRTLITEQGIKQLVTAIKNKKSAPELGILGELSDLSRESSDFILDACAERSLDNTLFPLKLFFSYVNARVEDYYADEGKPDKLHVRAMRLLKEAQDKRLGFLLSVLKRQDPQNPTLTQPVLVPYPKAFLPFVKEIFEMADCTLSLPKTSPVVKTILTELVNLVTGVLSQKKEMAENSTMKIENLIRNNLDKLRGKDIKELQWAFNTSKYEPLEPTLQSDIFHRVERCKAVLNPKHRCKDV